MNKERVKMNLIEQNVFVRVETPKLDLKDDCLIESYVSQDEVVENNSVVVKRTVQDYPITPDSVNSYADGTNYRLDVNSAVSRSAPGKNIGDVAALQDFLSKSPEEISSIFSELKSKILADREARRVASENAKQVLNVEDSNNGK